MGLRVLVACEFSGIVRDAFIAAGHDAVSCDLLPCEKPGPHHQGDVLNILADGWDLMIGHPPCDYLSNAGAKHLYIGGSKENSMCPERVVNCIDGADFFLALWNAPIPMICLENPIQHALARQRIGVGWTQTVQPWQFGRKETKRTCLWLKGLMPLRHTEVVGPPPKDPEERKSWERVWRMAPGPDRKKERSRFFPGVAAAMADQWGGQMVRKSA